LLANLDRVSAQKAIDAAGDPSIPWQAPAAPAQLSPEQKTRLSQFREDYRKSHKGIPPLSTEEGWAINGWRSADFVGLDDQIKNLNEAISVSQYPRFLKNELNPAQFWKKYIKQIVAGNDLLADTRRLYGHLIKRPAITKMGGYLTSDAFTNQVTEKLEQFRKEYESRHKKVLLTEAETMELFNAPEARNKLREKLEKEKAALEKLRDRVKEILARKG